MTLPLFNIFCGIGLIFGVKSFFKSVEVFNSYKYISKYKEFIILCLIFFYLIGSIFIQNVFNLNFSFKINNGFTFYGGLIFIILFVMLLSLYKKIHALTFLNLITPSILITHAFGRIGCFFAGCCFGIKNINFNFFIFNGRIPIQLIESISLFILFYFIIRRISFQNWFLSYLFSYSIIRFFLEFLRDDPRGVFLLNIFSPSQFISVIILFIISIKTLKIKN